MFRFLLIGLLLSFTFKEGDNLVIDTSIDSCDKYRNVQIIFIKCGEINSRKYIANCKIDSNRIVVPDIMKYDDFRLSYESSTHMKIKILKGITCDERIIKL
jgi:hypothetical protein